ncbi:PIWIL1 [Symbiodinium sp. CCMP2456]|nr:PIWIL1 [Symbiodinium sp. CCMP2456]
MSQDKLIPTRGDGITAAKEMPGDVAAKTFKVRVNLFRMNWTASIHQYGYELPETWIHSERKLLEMGWADLKQNLSHFVVLLPGRIFSPTKVDKFPMKVSDASGGQVDVCHVTEISVQKIQDGLMGPASVVGQHLADQLAGQRRIQRVGKRFYKNDCQQVEGQHRVISGYSVKLAKLGSAGPLLQLDVLHKPANTNKSIVEVLRGSMEGTDVFQALPEIRAEWLRLCVSATVVTNYNSRVYRIKQVHFDMNPSQTFQYHVRGGGAQEYTYADYLFQYYQKTVTFKQQPILEAYPEKATEKVFLLPEFCCPVGVTDEMRKEKTALSEVLKQIKASPMERHNEIVRHGEEMEKQLPETLNAWGCHLGQPIETLEVEAKQLEPLQVCFSTKQMSAIEEGSFGKSIRGVQRPVMIDQWLLFYPETDEKVVDTWLKSLRDVAQVAFGCKLNQPTKVCYRDPFGELQSKIVEHKTPSIQLMMLLISGKYERNVYTSFKLLACEHYPCISQVVRSETLGKGKTIPKQVIQQIHAKFGGALWQIVQEPEDDLFLEFKRRPFMILGIDVYRTFEGARWLGICASLDKVFSQYYSMAAELEKGPVQKCWTSLSVELQRLFRDALSAFTDCNDGILPETIVVYRASVNQKEWPLVDAVEVQALLQVLNAAAKLREGYVPKVVMLGIARKANMRIFKSDEGNIRNPHPGTVVDDPAVCPGPTPEFYMISQAIGKGSAVPTHYSVLLNKAEMPLQMIENLTNRLCLMYYNVPSGVRVPAPVLYATKIACFCGNVIKKPPRPRLQRTLFFL